MPGTATTPQRVVGVVQHYAWGDTEFIPRLLGVEPDGEPWAELWLGTHANGPTTFADGTPLADVTGELPYLLKVLAAAEPLSLQAHPTGEQARAGFERGVFVDPHPKPELLVALTEFEALCGFRPPEWTIELLDRLGARELADAVRDRGSDDALQAIYHRRVDLAAIVAVIDQSADPLALWIGRLGERYGLDDPSVVAALLLNHVVLAPGEAIRLTAGNLHAYLRGAGIELMGASDNVVRGGLTVKPVDVELLLATVDTRPLRDPILPVVDGRYALPEAGVQLVWLDPGATYTATGHELAITLDGSQLYLAPGTELTTTADTFVVTPA
ncbi:MAG: mannose-6-phosphate isomerase, class I [Ilumatobacter sp.]|nr:mannose-6-phosphate isomerase, class I [Ilumatobacter sp.]